MCIVHIHICTFDFILLFCSAAHCVSLTFTTIYYVPVIIYNYSPNSLASIAFRLQISPGLRSTANIIFPRHIILSVPCGMLFDYPAHNDSMHVSVVHAKEWEVEGVGKALPLHAHCNCMCNLYLYSAMNKN